MIKLITNQFRSLKRKLYRQDVTFSVCNPLIWKIQLHLKMHFTATKLLTYHHIFVINNKQFY